MSSAAETAVVVVPSALELLTILSFASAWELVWHVLTVAALLFRRRWPLAVFVLTLPVAFDGYLLIAPLAALYQVARQVRRRRTLVCCVLLLFVAGLGPWLPTEEEPFNFEDALFGLLSAAMLSAGPAATGRLVRTRAQLSDRLAELARTQERERELLSERAVVEERARLAREMHDLVSHRVSMISLQAGALQVTSTEPGSQEIGRTIHGLSVSTLEELRHLVGVLRAPRGRQGLAELPSLVETSGLDALFDDGSTAPGDWPPTVGEAAYRTVQEALTNVRKYAPQAAVTVTLSTGAAGPSAPAGSAGCSGAGGRALVVEIRNSPVAPDGTPSLPAGGNGLTGLRERAELLGGTLTAGPHEDGGFVVRAVLPAGDSAEDPTGDRTPETGGARAVGDTPTAGGAPETGGAAASPSGSEPAARGWGG
ncbi:histidine kinase [Streptomyces sp. XM4193]|nr:histidine kinase [Streptomyces sp. XM4193]